MRSRREEVDKSISVFAYRSLDVIQDSFSITKATNC